MVKRADLGIGNARLMTAGITMNQLVGPALGAALFVAGMAWPFVVQAVCVGLGAVLVSRMVVPVLYATRHLDMGPVGFGSPRSVPRANWWARPATTGSNAM